MAEKDADVIIVGGGASGMMCAGIIAAKGKQVLILEKNKELGKKLSISGGGRCNITNAELDVREFLKNFPESSKFLFSPFSQFSVKETFTFFEKRGLPLVIEARKRVFPKSQNASDVVDVLKKGIENSNTRIFTGTPIRSITHEDGIVTGVITKGGKAYKAPYVVLAVGGAAAPETGSNGDGFRMLREIEHTVADSNPNIVPLKVNEKWVHKLSGTTCSFMEIRFSQNGKTKIKKKGKILFTHFGISGPLVLNTSFEVSKLLEKGPVHAEINLFPDTNEGDLDKRVVKLFDKNKNKKLRNVLPELLQKSLAHAVIFLANPALGEVSVHSISKEERKKLVKTMQSLGFMIAGTMGLDRAVIADGGVALEEVDFSNMTSRKFPNLYLLGDILHINRPSGGFSLQLCWTTAWVAAQDILKRLV
ncbi:aminoacetone oxidase family FAD-binding enzyme [bacterium]|mgnify:CR=1 FL=1|nr:aminoacetone oxidase family FAD-binding enzyme [bacterium]|tara:strand:+ start:13284 stop:14543 length:1260 start_codon:yes stop_codon:yes gene_type:complete